MFGILKPAHAKLARSERQSYASFYCNLCGTLGTEYGISSRMLVVHDFATLAWLLAPETVLTLPFPRVNCVPGRQNPARKQPLPPYVRYLAAISAFTMGVKLQDNERDDRSWLAAAANSVYRRTFSKSRVQLDELGISVAALDSMLAQHQVIEASAEANLEIAAMPTGAAYAATAREISRLGETSISSEQADAVGASLGAAIYAIDAMTDFTRDQGRSYNPLCNHTGAGSRSLPASVRDEAIAFIENRLVSASDVFRRLDITYQHRWNAVADQLVAHLRPFSPEITLYAHCCIPCEGAFVILDGDECAKAFGCCCCCACCIMSSW